MKSIQCKQHWAVSRTNHFVRDYVRKRSVWDASPIPALWRQFIKPHYTELETGWLWRVVCMAMPRPYNPQPNTDRMLARQQRCWTNAGVMLVHRRRRGLALFQHWVNILCLLGRLRCLWPCKTQSNKLAGRRQWLYRTIAWGQSIDPHLLQCFVPNTNTLVLRM